MPVRLFRYLLGVMLVLGTPLMLQAQSYKVRGRVFNSRKEVIPYATIQARGSRSNVISKEDGSFELNLPKGSYRFLVTMIGYKPWEELVEVHGDLEKDIMLEPEAQNLAEFVLKVKAKDRAEEVMRQVIRKKDSIQSAAGPFSCKVYIKATKEQTGSGSNGRNIDKQSAPHSGGMSMAEISLKLDVQSENRVKEERLGVSKYGSTSGMFYLSATDGNFNFYNNLVNLPSISPTPFVSPVSNSGLLAYKFKTVKVKRTGKFRIYTISVKPVQLSNATVEGEVVVSDSAWVILHSKFRFPRYHLQEFDFFEVEQDFQFVDGKAWMLNWQQFTYFTEGRRQKISGQTFVSYSEYELNKKFQKSHFRSELSSTSVDAYTKDSTFWQKLRYQPLSEKEEKFLRQQDSLFLISKTDAYLDSLDQLINKITWKKVGFFGQSFRDHRKERTWHLSPLRSMIQPFAFGGGRIGGYAFYQKVFPSRKYLSLNTNLSYGLRNNDVNGSVEFHKTYNTFSRAYYNLSAGREFAFINEGDAWINMIRRNNIFLNNYFGAGYGRELVNGLVISGDAQFALRRSVHHYETGKLVDSIFTDVLQDNQPVSFDDYNALYGKVKLMYTPAQRYRREPKEKIILGSAWPSFYVQWEKGIPELAGSKVDFDYLEFGIEQSIKMGLMGVSRYTVKTGEFINTTDLRLIDNKVMRRGDPLLFMNPYKSFQALDSSFPAFKRFYEGHLFHEFNGLFINKIPFLKKLQLREVGGAGFLLAPERNLRYAELYAGIERAFESPFNPLDKFKLGIYIVTSTSNQHKDPVQFKIGFTTWDKRRNRWF